MRKIIKEELYPEIGDKRIVKKFLWFPKTMYNVNGEKEERSLEFVEYEQEYRPFYDRAEESCGGSLSYIAGYRWFNIRWLN